MLEKILEHFIKVKDPKDTLYSTAYREFFNFNREHNGEGFTNIDEAFKRASRVKSNKVASFIIFASVIELLPLSVSTIIFDTPDTYPEFDSKKIILDVEEFVEKYRKFFLVEGAHLSSIFYKKVYTSFIGSIYLFFQKILET